MSKVLRIQNKTDGCWTVFKHLKNKENRLP